MQRRRREAHIGTQLDVVSSHQLMLDGEPPALSMSSSVGLRSGRSRSSKWNRLEEWATTIYEHGSLKSSSHSTRIYLIICYISTDNFYS